MSAAAVFLFYRIWGFLTELQQTSIVMAASVATLSLTAWLRRSDRYGYFCRLSALITMACFVLNIVVLGEIYNIHASNLSLLAWAMLALTLAYGCRSPLLLAVGLSCIICFIATCITMWNGWYWSDFSERQENFFPAALLVFILPLLCSQQRFGRWFEETYRPAGLLALFIPILVLACNGRLSYLSL